MPKKGSRPITVDGADFRWQVRRKATRHQRNGRGPLTFSVEFAEEPGQLLVVSLPFPRPDNDFGDRTLPIRPVIVAGCVRRAVEQGWNPGQPGSAFNLTITEADLPLLLNEPPRHLIPFLWGMIPEGGDITDLPRCTEIWSRRTTNITPPSSDP